MAVPKYDELMEPFLSGIRDDSVYNEYYLDLYNKE